MKRHDRGNRPELEDLDQRLDALREPRRLRKRPIWRSVLLGLVLVVGVFGAVYLIFASATGGGSEQTEAPVTVAVEEGDTLQSVAEKLKEAGIVSSAALFELEARVNDQSTNLKPGEYRFRPGEDAEKILAEMTTGVSVPVFDVTVPEGLTTAQTAGTVADQSKITEDEFVAAAKRTGYGYAFLENPRIETTEGFLFPKKYEFEQGTTASQVVNRMLEQYLLETQSLDLKGASERLGLTEYEILTVASLIEREAANPEERRLVASVIYNRLRRDTPLQIDATIQYARGEAKEDLSLADLEINSPYNTYENEGLPPGPICSPGLDSIEAAMNPADTGYLYYVLKSDGNEHFFTRDYDEFLAAKARAGR